MSQWEKPKEWIIRLSQQQQQQQHMSYSTPSKNSNGESEHMIDLMGGFVKKYWIVGFFFFGEYLTKKKGSIY